MLGVVAAMRRTLLSCTSLARNGLMGLAFSALLPVGSGFAADLGIADAISDWLDLNHQEFAVLATAFALLGFSVVSAILLMRNRTRAGRNESKLRAQINELTAQTDRLSALLFVEPQVLISWPAGGDRPRISGDVSLLLPEGQSPHRVLAFGSWLPPDPALQMDRALDALREKGEGFMLNLATSAGRAVEAMGRAIGGQAIVRIRELSGVRRELAESNMRYKTLLDETELLRDFAGAAPWPIWAKDSRGALRYANAAYAKATEAKSVADAILRNLELLESDQCADMSRALNDNAAYSARLPVVLSGERRTYDVQAMKFPSGSAAIAVDASEVAQMKAALQRMAEAHRRTLDQLSSGVAVFDASRRLAFYNESYRRLWGLDQAFLDACPDDSSVLDRLRATRKLPEQPDFRAWKTKLHEGLSRGGIGDLHLVPAR
jgi:PAS domain-containing protein